MSFIAHFGGDLKEGKMREFQEWLAANEQAIADSHPEGTKYIGTYVAIYSHKGVGTVHSFIELDSYGAQDAMAAAGLDANSTYGRLMNEYVAFFDQESEDYTQALYKSVTAATLYGE
ncbi:MAG: hypothetical protein QNJ75_06820 [Acidimicrobiia bacterium]|nr:hypothetical protein [Acidimicrobiia bacterium]